ncbi:MAG: cysteine-rich CWC family protein [Halieaceae bacterium]|nr:cysteine-rich CWC family protein [Halieaceae bacterium]
MSTDPTENDAGQHCPLCGADNHCAIAAGKNAIQCWCMRTEFPQTLLDRVPDEAKNRVCICERCVQQALTGVSE